MVSPVRGFLPLRAFAYPSFEGTEANQLNLVFLSNGFFNGINKCVYSLFLRLFLGIAVWTQLQRFNSLLFISKSSSILIAPSALWLPLWYHKQYEMHAFFFWKKLDFFPVLPTSKAKSSRQGINFPIFIFFRKEFLPFSESVFHI